MDAQKTHKKVSMLQCEICNYSTSRNSNLIKHYNTNKHLLNTTGIKKVAKVRRKYHCEKCDFTTHNKTDYKRHINTIKCKTVTKTQENVSKPQPLYCQICDYNTINETDYISHVKTCQAVKKIFECKCGKTFNGRSGLWRHKKICKFNMLNSENTNKFVEMVVELAKSQFPELIEKNENNFAEITDGKPKSTQINKQP